MRLLRNDHVSIYVTIFSSPLSINHFSVMFHQVAIEQKELPSIKMYGFQARKVVVWKQEETETFR